MWLFPLSHFSWKRKWSRFILRVCDICTYRINGGVYALNNDCICLCFLLGLIFLNDWRSLSSAADVQQSRKDECPLVHFWASDFPLMDGSSMFSMTRLMLLLCVFLVLVPVYLLLLPFASRTNWYTPEANLIRILVKARFLRFPLPEF